MEVDVFFIKNAQVVPAVELERRVSHTGMFCIIISKFRHR